MSKFSLPSQPLLPIYFMVVFSTLAIFGILISSTYLWAGILLTVFCLFAVFARFGNEFNKEKYQTRAYTGIFGFKWGKWHSMEDYTCLVVLHKRMTSVTYGGRTILSAKDTDNRSSIHLSAPSHLKKRMVYETKNSKNAQLNAKRLSDYLEIPIERYNPKPLKKRKKR